MIIIKIYNKIIKYPVVNLPINYNINKIQINKDKTKYNINIEEYIRSIAYQPKYT